MQHSEQESMSEAKEVAQLRKQLAQQASEAAETAQRWEELAAQQEQDIAGYQATIEELGRPYPKVVAMLEAREEGKRAVLEQENEQLRQQVEHYREEWRLVRVERSDLQDRLVKQENLQENGRLREEEIQRLSEKNQRQYERIAMLVSRLREVEPQLAESKQREEADSEQIAGLLRDLEGVPRMAELQQQLAEAQAQCAAMRIELEFYGRGEHYKTPYDDCQPETPVWDDKGKRARKALASDGGRQLLEEKQVAEARVKELAQEIDWAHDALDKVGVPRFTNDYPCSPEQDSYRGRGTAGEYLVHGRITLYAKLVKGQITEAEAKVKQLSAVSAAAHRLADYHRDFIRMPREAYLAALGLLDALAVQEEKDV